MFQLVVVSPTMLPYTYNTYLHLLILLWNPLLLSCGSGTYVDGTCKPKTSLEYTYSQTSLVSTPGDPPNCYSLSVVLANHID